ncbi:MAG TPA: DMT family transporter [Frankiaceae bacterium]|nr:DMT family transporter [Frankiaceae bacterium]
MPQFLLSRLPAHRRASAAPTLALVGLLLVTASWGSTFFMLRGVVSRMPAADFLAVRFVIAAAVVWMFAPKAVCSLSRSDKRRAIVLGLVYGTAQLVQTIGLTTTSASVSGFITGLYVVLTPLLAALVLRVRLGRRVWGAVVLATVGLGALSLQGVTLGSGALLTLLGALFYALHVVGLGVWSRNGNTVGMTIVQLLTISVVCTVGALPDGITLPTTGADWWVLVYMAAVAGAVALLVQTWAQAQVSATRAAITMTMEPVWAATFAVLFGGEALGLRTVVGGVLVLTAMYVVELGQVRPAAAVGPDVEAAIYPLEPATGPAGLELGGWELDGWELDALEFGWPEPVCAGAAGVGPG